MREYTNNSMDSLLWHACAGGMVQLPNINTKVFYFPQGHAEHAQTQHEFPPQIPPFILSKVVQVDFKADPETDEVYAKMTLEPLQSNTLLDSTSTIMSNEASERIKPISFAKTLTQSDANNGGGFSVPRYCADTIFPPLDYSADPPVQAVITRDVHGHVWKFRHIYRGTPRRHLLTTGWSNFVNHKKLVAGDSIVFLKPECGEIRIGIKRVKRMHGPDSNRNNSNASSWNIYYDTNKVVSNGDFSNIGKIGSDNVVEASNNAACGRVFEVVYYPWASTPEFCVREHVVRNSMRTHWCPGVRFKMAFETEDSARISWFMGTVSAIRASDSVRWINSPWRLLQVTWDEPDMLQNVKCVSPWLVELISIMPMSQFTSFSPLPKKLRTPQPLDFPPSQFQLPSLSSIQGSRQDQFGTSSPNSHFYDNMPNFPHNIQLLYPNPTVCNKNISCLLTMGNSNPKNNKLEKPHFLLFGQPILTEQQMTQTYSSDAVSETFNLKKTKNSSDDFGSTIVQTSPPENTLSPGSHGFQTFDYCLENSGHCKVFLESEDLGRTIDLSAFGCYDELHRRLANMYGFERSEMLRYVLYLDANGDVKCTGDEPFCVFVKTATKLTILMDSGCHNIARSWTGMRNAENGLNSPNKMGLLSIFA